MAETEVSADAEGITFEWIQIANAVAQGRLTPEEGVSKLQALAEAHPADREWLQDEMETIRRQFGLDVVQSIRDDQGDYWDKTLSVINALLDERLDHERALELLTLINTKHPEHAENTNRLIRGLKDSPMRRLLKQDD